MRFFAAVLLIAAGGAACGGGLFTQYEYEEDMYLALDGRATVYVNSSVAALDVLRGAALDARPTAPLDRAAVARFFTSPVTHVGRIAQSRRSGRRFVHVRVDVDDVRRLSEAKPFAWSTYRFVREGNLFVYRQTVGPPAAHAATDATGWNGREAVAFRLHVPSKIAYHNTRPDNLRRGNILVWEQSLTDRLRGEPMTLDARMATQSILYRTLWLFAVTFLVVAATLLVIVWWVARRAPAASAEDRAGVEAR